MMKMKRFELSSEMMVATINEQKITLHRVVALKSFNTLKGRVYKGDIGGWIETEDNISQYSNAWVFGDGIVFGYTELLDNSIVFGNAVVGGNTITLGDTRIFGHSIVYGDGLEIINSAIYGNATVGGDYYIDNLCIGGESKIAKRFIAASDEVRNNLYGNCNNIIPIVRSNSMQVNFAY